MKYSQMTKKELVEILEAREREKLNVPEGVFNFLRDYQKEKQEHFIVICLDASFSLICSEVITKGLVNRSLIHSREVFRFAIKNNAVSIIIAHNHPSGDLTPSVEDFGVTDRLVKTGKLIGIPVIDHVIIGGGNYYSMGESKDFCF